MEINRQSKSIVNKSCPVGAKNNLKIVILSIVNKNRKGLALLLDPEKANLDALPITELCHPDYIFVGGSTGGDTTEFIRALRAKLSPSLVGRAGEGLFIVDLAERLQDCGIQELAIHGRTRSQMYRGEADWTLIGEVKNNPRMHIPIIGNGDVCTPERAKECFDKYGVDAIMIGRATFGAPWIFSEMKAALDPSFPPLGGGAGRGLSMADKVAVLKEHVLASISWCGNDERKGIVHSRRHFAASPVFKGLFDFKQTRIALLRAETVAEVFAIMDDIVAKWGNE